MNKNKALTPILQGKRPNGQRSHQGFCPICNLSTQSRYPYKLNLRSLAKGLATVNEWFEKVEGNPLDISTLEQLKSLVLTHTVFLTDPKGYKIRISQGNLTLVCAVTLFYERGNG